MVVMVVVVVMLMVMMVLVPLGCRRIYNLQVATRRQFVAPGSLLLPEAEPLVVVVLHCSRREAAAAGRRFPLVSTASVSSCWGNFIVLGNGNSWAPGCTFLSPPGGHRVVL